MKHGTWDRKGDTEQGGKLEAGYIVIWKKNKGTMLKYVGREIIHGRFGLDVTVLAKHFITAPPSN